MQTVLISTQEGLRSVEAHIIGPFAVHVDSSSKPIGYTVTHLFTGLAIISRLTNEGAKKIAETLPQLDDWYFSAPDLPDYTERHGSKELKQRVAKSRKWLRETFAAPRGVAQRKDEGDDNK